MTNTAPQKSERVARLRQLLNLSGAEIRRLTNRPFEAIETIHATLGGRDSPDAKEALDALSLLNPRYRPQFERAAQDATALPAAQKALPPGPQRLREINGLRDINLLEAVPYKEWFIPGQGPRETCVAYAAAACIELLRARESGFERLSAQFLYWYMRTTKRQASDHPPGWAQGATRLSYAKEVLKKYGICPEAVCWSGFEWDFPLAGREPDQKATDEARKIRITSDSEYVYRPKPAECPGIAEKIYNYLKAGSPVAIALPEFPKNPGSSITNWNNLTTWSSGIVADPPEGSVAHKANTPGHAVCIVGFQHDPGSGGGWFLFRNSLGGDWADSADPARLPRVPAPGYGAISAVHVEGYCWEMLCPKLR